MTFQITDEVLEEAEECGALGLTMEQTAWNLGVNPSTLYRNKAKSGVLQDALTRGRAKGIRNMTGNLRDQAEAGSTHATIFYLKNRSPDEWANDMQSVAKIQVNLARISDSELLGELREDPALLKAVNLTQIESNGTAMVQQKDDD